MLILIGPNVSLWLWLWRRVLRKNVSGEWARVGFKLFYEVGLMANKMANKPSGNRQFQ
jgi:hypothetical protein